MQNNANEMAVFNTAIYVRLSKEDIVAAQSGRESNSITNQKQLILDFLKDKPEFNIVSIRIDDGYTGTNFDRPAFQRMLNDIKAGRINCVVVKDLSRFGREYINSGKYIHRLFPVLGVRLIAINDNIDTITRALMGGKAAVFASGHSTAWSVLYRELDGSGADEDVASLMSPLNRTVNVVAVPDLLDAARRLTSCRGWLQSCGVAVDSARLFGLADTLAEVGVNRICPLGEMDRAKSGWHHDGGFNLIDLLRAVDVERGSDAYSDSFDMDME